ncbi:type II secretion system protein [Sulfurovum sp.]|uniref:type II secretion system protein n=1 Tax=Sulfurovum sp. TaxID=1969726 RepID=UPI003562F23D
MLKRAAFTMIELIFAIVIIGVTVLTVPLMIETNNKALEGNIAQEAIFLVSSVLSTTTALVWDEKSITSTGSADNYVLSKILDVGSVGSTYGRIDAASTLRIGGLREDKHRQFFDYNGAPTAPLQVGEETLVVPLDNSVAAIAGYKQAYTIVAKRVYVSDTIADPFVFSTSADAGQTNLKMTEISINGEDGAVIANLRAYTANIGEVDYAKRSF